MLAKARQVLVGELALAEIKDEAKANELLAEVDATIVRHRLQGGDDTPEPKHPQPIIDDDDTDLDDLNFDHHRRSRPRHQAGGRPAQSLRGISRPDPHGTQRARHDRRRS